VFLDYAQCQKTGKPHNVKNRLEQENKKAKVNVTYVWGKRTLWLYYLGNGEYTPTVDS